MSDRKVARYFDKSTSLARDAFTQFEQQYARPAYSNMQVYFRERPIISTFVTIFTLLNLVPIAFFAGIVFLAFVTFTLTALCLAVAASFTVILVGFAFLLIFLIGSFLLSLFLTGAALSSYAFLRLALHVQREGPSIGVSEWSKETKYALLSKPPMQEAENENENEKDPTPATSSEGQHEGEVKEHLPASLYDGDDQSDLTLRKEESDDEEDVKRRGNSDPHDFSTNIKREDGEIKQGYQ